MPSLRITAPDGRSRALPISEAELTERRTWRAEHRRLQRHAEQWAQGHRTDHLALRPAELRRTLEWLEHTPPRRRDRITPLLHELIAASAGANRRLATKRALARTGGALAVAGLVTAAVLGWPEPADTDRGEVIDDEPSATAKLDLPPVSAPTPPPSDPDDERVVIPERIVHVVIPEESLDDIARRYGVSVDDLARWNLLNPDQGPPPAGATLVIERPKQRPLPRQRIRYELEPEDASWKALSERFGVSVSKLRAYNPHVQQLHRGQEIAIWIDPHPYQPKQPRTTVSDYVLTTTAESVGPPNAGSLEHGIQLPSSDLYIRRYPNIMWGSGYLVANVQKAVAMFRNDMDFDGTLVLADISQKHGGRFSPPHGSHQSGGTSTSGCPRCVACSSPSISPRTARRNSAAAPTPRRSTGSPPGA